MEDQDQQPQEDQQCQFGDQSGEEGGETAGGRGVDLGYPGVDREQLGLYADADEDGQEGGEP